MDEYELLALERLEPPQSPTPSLPEEAGTEAQLRLSKRKAPEVGCLVRLPPPPQPLPDSNPPRVTV